MSSATPSLAPKPAGTSRPWQWVSFGLVGIGAGVVYYALFTQSLHVFLVGEAICLLSAGGIFASKLIVKLSSLK